MFSALVGRARVRHKVDAPATVGPPEFERYYRVHYNTLEQLIIVLPSMWIFGYFVHTGIAAALGVVFMIGRILYLRGYVAAPETRGRGFVIGILATSILCLGGLIGAVIAWLS